MAKSRNENRIKVDSHTIELSNRGKILFPEDKITKGDLVEYYLEVAKTMMPHLRGRPITMHRYPNGIMGEGFIQQDAPDYYPLWIKREYVKRKAGGTIDHVLCENAATLAYLANQACITIHTWLSVIDAPDSPDKMIFDLDPAGNDFEPVRLAAEEFRKLLVDEFGLPAYAMTTGSRGLHVAVPLDRKSGFDEVRHAARDIAALMVGRYPSLLTAEIRKDKRNGRLFVDIARNAYGQTAVAPYSVRARKGASVATPIHWEELEDKKLTSDRYNIKNIFKRLKDRDDPWKDIEKKGISLAAVEKKLYKMKAKKQEVAKSK
jgi:bifunctional non-homologous end joining protein LigD